VVTFMLLTLRTFNNIFVFDNSLGMNQIKVDGHVTPSKSGSRKDSKARGHMNDPNSLQNEKDSKVVHV